MVAMKKATIRTSDSGDCLVDRISDKGARIHFATPCELPLEFYIKIEGDDAPRYCAVARRGRGRIDVYFV